MQKFHENWTCTFFRVPTFLLTKISRTFPGPPWEIFQDLFGVHECLNTRVMKKPFPPSWPCPPLPPLPLEVGPFKSSWGIWRSAVSSSSMGSGAEPQRKSNLVHSSIKIWHLVTTFLTILLRINWPNWVLEMREISVMHNFQGYFSRTFQVLEI